MIAGAGGNNSWLLRIIHELQRTHQINEDVEFTVYDGDTVEQKNLLYQDFTKEDLLDNKAEVLSKRYAFFSVPAYIQDPHEFDNYDIVICGVDNKKFREMLYRYMNEHPEKYWIDLRAEGHTVSINAKSNKISLEELLNTLPKTDSGGNSCQLSYELDAGIIQLGNRIAATIGAQYLLNHLRGEENPPSFIHMF